MLEVLGGAGVCMMAGALLLARLGRLDERLRDLDGLNFEEQGPC